MIKTLWVVVILLPKGPYNIGNDVRARILPPIKRWVTKK